MSIIVFLRGGQFLPLQVTDWINFILVSVYSIFSRPGYGIPSFQLTILFPDSASGTMSYCSTRFNLQKERRYSGAFTEHLIFDID